MEKDVVQGDIGNKGHYDLELNGDKLVAKVDVASPFGPAASPYGSAKVSVEAELEAKAIWDLFANKTKAAIPGKIDDAILDVMKAAIFGA
jgi:hypothetical protein